MSIASGVGYALISLGPGFALFILTIASKPFLVLTLLVSTLSWLVSLVAIASVWRAFVPLTSSWLYVLLLFSAVAVQEVVRVCWWRVFEAVQGRLDGLAARASKPPLSFSEKSQIALAIGFGHGLAHSVLFCVGLLTPALGPGTFYLDSCSQMPFFLVISLMSLAFLLIHTFSMLIAFRGFEEKNKTLQAFVPVMHGVASFLTLVNLIQGGCVTGIPLAMVCAAITLCVCGRLTWQKSG